MRNVITTEGGCTVDRGWRLDIPACTADACNSGRAPCPCPDACVLPDEEASLLSNRAFWLWGAACVGAWTGLWALIQSLS